MTYPALSSLLSTHPSLQIFQHFSELNVKSLLYYQAELAQLAADLAEVEKEDAECGLEPRCLYQTTFWRLRDCERLCGEGNRVGDGADGIEEGNGDEDEAVDDSREAIAMTRLSWHAPPGTEDRESSRPTSPSNVQVEQVPSAETGSSDQTAVGVEDGACSGTSETESFLHRKNEWLAQRQWKLICQIRIVLDEYHKTLARQLDIHNRWPSPRNQDLNGIRSWLSDGRFGAGFLAGRAEDVWDEEKGLDPDDYVAVADTGDDVSNSLASLMLGCARMIEKLRNIGKTSDDAKIRSFKGQGYQRIVNSVVTVVASVLLILPIVILYIVKDMAARVGLVFLFTVVLSGLLSFGLGMNAEKVIMIATGFAAVQVVFVATNSGGTG